MSPIIGTRNMVLGISHLGNAVDTSKLSPTVVINTEFEMKERELKLWEWRLKIEAREELKKSAKEHYERRTKLLLEGKEQALIQELDETYNSYKAVLERTDSGSLRFILSFLSEEDMQYFWQKYESGELEESLTGILVTAEMRALAEKSGCTTRIKLKIDRKEFDIVKEIMHAENTADEAVYLLSGLRTIEAEVDIKKLSLLGRILQNKDSPEFRIGERQIALKDLKSNSWFSDLKSILHKYQLQDIYHLFSYPPQIKQWKLLINKKVNSYWQEQLEASASKKNESTLSQYIKQNQTRSPSDIVQYLQQHKRITTCNHQK
ncbi:uncharacterized protein LOC144450053 [Glandiceps talaboti]